MKQQTNGQNKCLKSVCLQNTDVSTLTFFMLQLYCFFGGNCPLKNINGVVLVAVSLCATCCLR